MEEDLKGRVNSVDAFGIEPPEVVGRRLNEFLSIAADALRFRPDPDESVVLMLLRIGQTADVAEVDVCRAMSFEDLQRQRLRDGRALVDVATVQRLRSSRVREGLNVVLAWMERAEQGAHIRLCGFSVARPASTWDA